LLQPGKREQTIIELDQVQLTTPLEPRARNCFWAAAAVHLTPRWSESFPWRQLGVWFGDKVLPCFGLWNGIEPRRRERLGREDALKIPPIAARSAGPGPEVVLSLDGSGEQGPDEELVLGRGDAYLRNFVCDAPFALWLGTPRAPRPLLIAWFGDPAP